MAKKSAKSAKSARGAKSAKSAKSARGAGRTGAAAKTARKSTKSAKSTRGGSSRGASKKSAKSARSGRSGGGRGRTNAAFMAPVTPSSALAEVIGAQPMPRTEITKRLWAYIKKNNLQDQKNRRMIKADAALKPVFGGKNQVTMFEMTSLVNKQLS
jgi:chromatin remodeling complex protein RSC6